MDSQRKYKILSQPTDPDKKHNYKFKHTKLCLTSAKKKTQKIDQEVDMNAVRDKDVQIAEIKTEPDVNQNNETFCSEYENNTPPTGATVKEVLRRDGSESLFSTESSDKLSQKIEKQISKRVSELMLGERFSGVRRHTTSTDTNELRLSESCLGTTLSKDSSYVDFYNNRIRNKLRESIDTEYSMTNQDYTEKAEGGESPEKQDEFLNDTEDNTESIADTEANTVLDDAVDKTAIKIEKDDVLSISSGPVSIHDSDETEEESIICVTDSDETPHDENQENITRGSTELDHAVSSIIESLHVTTSSAVDRFFDNIPELSTPISSRYMQSFDPRRSQSKLTSRKSELRITMIEKGQEENIPESDKSDDEPVLNPIPEEESPDYVVSEQSPLLQESKSSECSSQSSSEKQPTVTEINFSANFHISVKIETPQSSSKKKNKNIITTPIVNINQSPINVSTKRKNTPNSPKPSTSKTPDVNKTVNEQPFRAPPKETEKELKNSKNMDVKATKTDDAIEIDDFTSNILDEIYGKDQWLTPQLKAKTVKKTDQSLLNFSSFNRNICANLESTRFTPVHNEPKDDMASRRSPIKDNKTKTVKKSSSKKETESVSTKKTNAKAKYLAICDSDTSSESNSDMTSDESWKCDSSTHSSDNEGDKIAKGKKRKQRIIRPPSYSASDDEDISDAWTDKKPKNIKSPLSNVLDSCEYKPRERLPATPVTGIKTKRKLFNPNKTVEDVVDNVDEVEDVIAVPIREPKDMDHDISRIRDDELSCRFELPLLPRAIERIKDKEIRTKTPNKTPSKKVETPSSGKTKKNLQYTPKSSVPVKKLGFLQSLDVNTSEELCDPEALRYRKNYKTLKTELTDKLFAIYNEKIFENELIAPCSWNKKLLNTAGRCHLTRTGGQRFARIELSEKVLTSGDRLRCTLIHEMCHAATWIFNGEDGHGKTWKGWAHKANSIFKELPKINTCHSYDIFYKYTYKCKLCNAKSHAHSKSKKVENIRCKICHGSIEIFLNKADKDGNVVSTPAKGASGFAKFVKENYSKVKRPAIGHAEVMKLLGEDFGKLSVEEKAKFK
uniref:CSON003111 protein n=1 Tax=Culicoides sonorensis TaxID=179676 RepID=A0A336LSJ3_CULSO